MDRTDLLWFISSSHLNAQRRAGGSKALEKVPVELKQMVFSFLPPIVFVTEFLLIPLYY